MKTEFKTKFLQHLIQKKEDKGFTLIELLVVIIIIGILSAIALPSFLNQANKAKQSEAKTYVGTMNRAQQAYYLEKNTFTDQFGFLGLGVATETANYEYAISAGGGGLLDEVANSGYASGPALKSYMGAVNTATIAATSEATTLAVLCEETNASATAPALANVNFASTGPTCVTPAYVGL